MFKLPYAICNDTAYTPEQWQPKHELQNKSKKNTTNETLMCPIGCKVAFHKAVDYTMKNGTYVHRRAHFAHVGEHGERCLYVQKYSGGGESKEHKDAKNNLAFDPHKKWFHQFCSAPGCTNYRDVSETSGYVTAKTEVRLNKWLFDVVYYDYDEILQIIEVKATHATDGEKRKWVIENYGKKYIEVGTRPLQDDDRNWEVIDFHETYTCEACATKQHTDAPRILPPLMHAPPPERGSFTTGGPACFNCRRGGPCRKHNVRGWVAPDFENGCDLCGGVSGWQSPLPCPMCGVW